MSIQSDRELKFKGYIRPNNVDGLHPKEVQITALDLTNDMVDFTYDGGGPISANMMDIVQSIGLVDRKGKDIYCHDIIKGQFTLFVTNEAFIGEVVWTGWCYAVSILRPITYRSSRPNNLDVTSRWEVIGNRFGTPELLTDEEKQKDLWKKWREQVLKEMEEERCG